MHLTKSPHTILKNDTGTSPYSVPVHGKDVPTGLLHQILKDAGLK